MPTIEQLRQKIERIDVSIIAKLAERKKLSQQIGKLKLQEGKDIIDLSQEKKIFENYESLTEQYRLAPCPEQADTTIMLLSESGK